jgi:outer membrane protein insertion porin family
MRDLARAAARLLPVALVAVAAAAAAANAHPTQVPAGGVEAEGGSRGEVVRAVRIEAEHPERLRPFVGIAVGRPLDREAVRRAVELMFATGRYEDVPVELERDGRPGVVVVFHPKPAPLLVAVRIEGHSPLSAGAVRRLARLRAGEPLWPSRLERAARDVALALVRRGHLEALVEPEAVRVAGGADAIFRVHAGPRVTVGRTAMRGDAEVRTLGLAMLARPRAGEVYRRGQAEAARDAMRRALLAAGRWRATVSLRETYDPARASMDLVFEVEPGPRMTLETRGETLPENELAPVRDLVRESGATSDVIEAGAERLESRLREQGHRDAIVRATIEPRESGEALVYDVRPGPIATATRVELRGADPRLLEGLRTQAERPIEDAAVEEDARTLVARLEADGHYEAKVEPELPDGGGHLVVTFVATPGPQATLAAVEVDSPPLPASAGHRGPMTLAVHEGQPYRAADVAAARDTLLAAWRRAGYLDARVRPEVSFAEAKDAATVRLVVEPGERTLVEHLVLAGLRRTRPTTVEREMALRSGEPFSFERVLDSQRRLSSLGIFERVSISELDPGRERERDVVVKVQEAPRTAVSWGVGYSEQDRLRGSVELTRRNLDGAGRTASVFARGSFRGSRLLANLREPWLLGRQLDSFATAFWEEERRTSFDYSRKGGILQVGRAIDPRTTVVLRYLYQDTHVYNVEVPIEEIDRQYRTYTVSGPSASVVFDTRDDPLEPRRGVFLSADTQLSLEALGGTSYLRGFLQATTVRPLRTDLVFVLSGRLGLASTFGQEVPLLPLPERFFAGGDYGPRGFPVDWVGPKVVGEDGQLYPTGGNAVVLGDAELRYNVTRAFQLASFLDLGNVYLEVRDVALRELRRSAGVGVRYRTPIGPIRLDWGYVLDHRPGESRSKFHLTIGHAF